MSNFLLRGSTLLLTLALYARAEAASGRVVLGYSAVWRDDASPPISYNYDGFTYVARAFLSPNPDGAIGVPDGYFHPTLESMAHRHGVKLLMSVGGGAGSDGRWVAIATSPQRTAVFLQALGRLMVEHHYDGIDIDWEPPPSTDAEGVAYTSLLKQLRSQFPQAVLTVAVDTNEYAVKFFSWTDVVASVNYVNAMTYDYSGPWGGVAGHATNLYPTGDYSPLPEHSVDEGMRNLVERHHVPPTKILMGLNFWGNRYRVNRLGDLFPKNTDGYSDNVSYAQVMDLLKTGKYKPLWDAHAEVPYLLRTDGNAVITYDDPKSVEQKCDYAKNLGCAGMMIWNAGADNDGEHAPLTDTVVRICGGKPSLLNRHAVEAQVVDLTAALQRQGQSSGVTPSLDSLTPGQLEALYSTLGKSWGQAADRLWQEQGEKVPAK